MISKIQQSLSESIKSAFNIEIPPENVPVVKTQNPAFGDLTSTVSMILSKQLGQKPVDISTKIIGELKIEGVDKIVVAPNGFINMSLSNLIHKTLTNQFNSKFGSSELETAKKVMIEFGQPNTHKLITVGHVKSAITGLSLSRLYREVGYTVIQANYFGDLGPYVAKCLVGYTLKNVNFSLKGYDKEIIENTLKFARNQEAKNGYIELAMELGRSYSFGDKVMKEDKELEKVIYEVNEKLYSGEDKELNELYIYTRGVCIRYQDKFFGDLGVKYDRQYPESEVWKVGLDIAKKNIGKVLVEDSDGSVIFKGDDKGLNTRVFITKKGTPTYESKDLGLAVKKFEEYPDLDLAIVMTSVEQSSYFKALIHVLEQIDEKYKGRYMHLGFGWLLFGNKKLSSRMGKKVDYEGIMSEMIDIAKKLIKETKEYSEEEVDNIARVVALSSFKFAILSHEFHKDINYDPESFVSFNGYSAPYILYAIARANSILEKAGFEYKTGAISDLNAVLNTEEELDILKKVSEFPQTIKDCVKNNSAHFLTKYVFDLSEMFNRFYNKYSILEESDESVKLSRLSLIFITSEVLKKGLYLLGIDSIEKM